MKKTSIYTNNSLKLKQSKIKVYAIYVLIIALISACSYAPPRDEVDKKNKEIGLYEEWLMGLIALRNLPMPFLNPGKNLNNLERGMKKIIKNLHYNAATLDFWRETYLPPEVIIFKSRSKNAFTLPGGFICITTGLIFYVKREIKNDALYIQVLASILAHELVHLYREHPKRHYVTMLLKNNISRQYREMAEGIQAAAGDFNSDYSKLLIKTILKAKEAGTKGYQAEMEFEADKMAVEILDKAGYNPEGLLKALELMKHHMGGVHGSYEDRRDRVKQAISELKK